MSRVRSRLLFAAERQTDRLARRFVSISAWVGIASCAFSCVGVVIGHIGFTSGLRVSCRRFRRSYGRGWIYEKERRIYGRSFRYGLLFDMIPPGVRWGLRAPKPAPRRHCLPGLSSCDSRPCTFYAGKPCTLYKPRNNCYLRISALTPHRHPGRRKTRPAPIYGRASRAV